MEIKLYTEQSAKQHSVFLEKKKIILNVKTEK